MKKFFANGILVIFITTHTCVKANIREERLINLDSPYTQGFLKGRFDLQHSWQEGDLNPVSDFTLTFGVLRRLDLQFELLAHNLKARAFDKIVEYQSNSWEWALKWQIWDQHVEDPLSLAISAHHWRYDAKRNFFDLKNGFREGPLKYHAITTGGQVIASYDFDFVGPTAVVKWYRRDRRQFFNEPLITFWIPAVGAWIEAISLKEGMTVHVIGDYHLTHGNIQGEKNAWGGGLRIIDSSQHIYTVFVSNTAGDLWEASIFGTSKMYYAFRLFFRF